MKEDWNPYLYAAHAACYVNGDEYDEATKLTREQEDSQCRLYSPGDTGREKQDVSLRRAV